MILRPEGTDKNHWISLQLAGTTSNRLALNARVRVTAGDLVQSGEVLSGGSYLSQNDLRLHFGLGAHTKADAVEITWPTGKKELLKDVAADHFYIVVYIVVEGQGIVPAASIAPAAAHIP